MPMRTVIAKVEGTVAAAHVVIGADEESAKRISVPYALPCGLDQRVIDAIKDLEIQTCNRPRGA